MLIRLLNALCSRSRALILRWRGAHIEGRVWLRAVEIPRGHKRIHLCDGVALDRGVTLLVSEADNHTIAIRLGQRVYINRYTIIDASEGIEIGEDTMIGPFVYITDHDHTTGEDERPASGTLPGKPVKIGPRCWIGAHASILKGVTLGAGAVVGAGSVVTKDVPSGATVVGNPARSIGFKS